MKTPNLKFCVFLISMASIIECALGGYIAYWREPFWNSVNTHNLHNFIVYIIYFSMAALTICYVSGYNQYIQNYTSLVYRYKYSRRALKCPKDSVEGQAQRIQEDCFSYPTLSISLITGLAKNIVLLGVFIVILLKQLGFLYLIIPILYAIIGTMIAAKLARPLIDLNYVNQLLEAKFRQMISKNNYGKVHRNNYNLFRTTKFLSYFQTFYGQIIVIIPYLILAPLYFSLKITFGIFMQCASSMNSVIDCMSYFINSFNDINRWLSCRRRLKELKIIE